MAEFIGVGYGQVVIWALLPAILYYVACFSAVHFEAKRRGLVGVPRSELPKLKDVFRERGHLFIPILTILAVMYSGYSAPLAALAGTLACFPVALLRKSTRGYVNFANIIDAMVDGARNCLPVALACACAGIVIAVVTLSGLGIVFTQFVIGLAKDTLILALVLTMFAGIVLGMGMPTTPAYIIMTALLVPAIIKLGVVVPAAHMFAFYFAILSAITPPVALAVFAAAGLAKADLWASGWASVKIGFAGFIVPFMFVYEPALLMIGDWPTIVASFVSASCGVVLFAAGLHGYLLTAASPWQRAVLIVGGALLIDPGLITDTIGAILALLVIVPQFLERRSTARIVKQTTPRRIAEPGGMIQCRGRTKGVHEPQRAYQAGGRRRIAGPRSRPHRDYGRGFENPQPGPLAVLSGLRCDDWPSFPLCEERLSDPALYPVRARARGCERLRPGALLHGGLFFRRP
jgi:TRAP transporter 4TM/12TM fusion protein